MIIPTPQTRRRLGLLFIGAVAAWYVVALYSILVDFVSEHRGVQFYRERPFLLGACVVIAVTAGLCIHFVVAWRNGRAVRKKNRELPWQTETLLPFDAASEFESFSDFFHH
jgi:hypothetical protein